MAFKERDKCAVLDCTSPCSGRTNLCESHMVPGMAFRIGDSTGVVAAWYVEHARLRGIIVLNDFALGDLFGGAEGFSKKLEQQGFSDIKLLETPEEFQAAKEHVAEAPGNWSGPWLTEYPWENPKN